MTQVLWPVGPRDAASNSPGTGVRIRRLVGAISIVGLFGSLIEATAIDPLDDSASPAQQLVQTAAHLPAVQSLAVLELLMAVFATGTIFTIVGAVRGRGVALASAGGVVGALGVVGMTLIAANHLFMVGLVGAGSPAGVLDSFRASAGFVMPLFFATPVALLLLAASAWRAHLTTWIPFAVVALFFALDLVKFLPGGELIPLIVGFAGYSAIAWAFFEWRSIRTARVLIPREVRNASIGAETAPAAN